MPPKSKSDVTKRKPAQFFEESPQKTKKRGVDPALGSRKRQFEKKKALKQAQDEEEEDEDEPVVLKKQLSAPRPQRKTSGKKNKPTSTKKEKFKEKDLENDVKTASSVKHDSKETEETIDIKEFDRMLEWLNKSKSKLGGSPNFPRSAPSFSKKITRREYVEQYSDYEFAYLQIVGFKAIYLHSATIQELNNGQFFTRNPGTQLLERVGGMTMHGDREGASAVVASAPLTLLRAFRVAQKSGDNGVKFFTTAFERDADPCLEGRLSHLLRYIEESAAFQTEAGTESQEGVPWVDTCLDLRAKLDSKGLIGEYLRVFTNMKLAEFAKKEGMTYAAAKYKHQNGALPRFDVWCTKLSFKEYLLSQGLGRAPSKKDDGSINSLSPKQVDEIIEFYVDLDSLSA